MLWRRSSVGSEGSDIKTLFRLAKGGPHLFRVAHNRLLSTTKVSWVEVSLISRTWVSEHFSAEPAHFKCKNLIQIWNIASPEYFRFLGAVLLRYDYIEVREFAQAKLIMYSLKITHNPKLSLSRILLYFCSSYLVTTIVVYTLFIYKLVCKQLPQSPFRLVVTTCYAN